MIDPKLLKDTGTDPLTLEEVYEMESTLTATPNHYDQLSLGMQNTGERIMTVRGVNATRNKHSYHVAELTFIILANGEGDIASLPMVGDVNIFLKGDPDDEDFEAEVGIMIAGAQLLNSNLHT